MVKIVQKGVKKNLNPRKGHVEKEREWAKVHMKAKPQENVTYGIQSNETPKNTWNGLEVSKLSEYVIQL